MIDFVALEVLVTEKDEDIYRRHKNIEQSYERRHRYALDVMVGFCIDRARDAYILGMPDVCLFLSGKFLEEALSIAYENKNPTKDIPDFYRLIEWAKGSILDSEHAETAHEVREKRNDYGHAYLKILRKKLKKLPDRRPFTDKEALETYEKAMEAKAINYAFRRLLLALPSLQASLSSSPSSPTLICWLWE